MTQSAERTGGDDQTEATGMQTITLCVSSREDVNRRALAAFGGEGQGERISFASVELLWRVLTEKRWAILRAMAGAGEMSIREVARRVERDTKAVHGDVHALLNAGVLDRTGAGKVEFPHSAVRVNFMLQAA